MHLRVISKLPVSTCVSWDNLLILRGEYFVSRGASCLKRWVSSPKILIKVVLWESLFECASFLKEPEVEFEAESQFEGKNLPQLTSLILNHLRKSIQKKHTLPAYKIRYSPLFPELKPQDEAQEVYVHDSLVTVGDLEVTVVGCSRLPELENGTWQYCTLSVDMLPWSQLAENRRAMWPTFEVVKAVNIFCS